MEKYEKEVTRLKEKLAELEFYRARVDELRTDSSSLLDANHLLTDQLSVCHKRIETVVDLENDLQKYKQQLASAAEVLCYWIYVLRDAFYFSSVLLPVSWMADRLLKQAGLRSYTTDCLSNAMHSIG